MKFLVESFAREFRMGFIAIGFWVFGLMGLLKALGIGFRIVRWRARAGQIILPTLNHGHGEQPLNLVNPRLGAARGLFYNAVYGAKAGSFSGGKFTAESENEDEVTEEDEDPDAKLGQLTAAEFGPFVRLFSTFMDNPSRDPKNMVTEWEESGNKFTRDVFVNLFKKLRTRKRDKQAYRLVHWVINEKLINISPKICQFGIMAAQKVRRLNEARNVFNMLSPEEKTPAMYTSLVTAYASQNEAKKAEAVVESFKPVTAQPFNSLMLMYIRMNEDEKAGKVYHRMREAGIMPSDLTIYTLAKYNRRLGIEIDKVEASTVLNECMKTLDTKKDSINAACNVLLAYAHMGDLQGVNKAWDYIEQQDFIVVAGHAAGLEAYALLGKMDKVKLIAKQVPEHKRREKSFYPALIRAYALNGMMDRAVGIVDNLKTRGDVKVSSACYDELICGYISINQPELALEKAKESMVSVLPESVRPGYLTVKKMMPIYRLAKDAAGAEEFFRKYRGWRDASIFNELLKVYVEAEKFPAKFEQWLRKTKVKADEETRLLLDKARAFA